MAPSRGGRKTVVVSPDDEDYRVDIDDFLSDDGSSYNGTIPKRKSLLKATKITRTKSTSSKPPSTKASPSKSPSKTKSTTAKSAVGKDNGSIYSFFSATSQRQQTSSQQRPLSQSTSPSKAASQTTTEQLDDAIDDGEGEVEIVNGSRTALAARKRKQNDVRRLFDGTAFSAAGGSQKFRKVDTGQKVSAQNKDIDRRPWMDRFSPADLSELAVHKKKVADVRALLEEALSTRARPRLLVLNGPAGSGKTITVQLLAADLGVKIKEWRNQNNVDFGGDGSISASAQFADFVFRSGKFSGLDLATESKTIMPDTNRNGLDNDHNERHIMLIEEFPSSTSSSQTFRNTLLAYLSTPHNPAAPSAPIVVVLSETLLSAGSSYEAVTPHRLLGPTLLTHPLTASIEFNPIAHTLLTKALSLTATKESRVSGRRRTPGPGVLSKLAEMGDIRSAVSALEFLCLRGDDADTWSAKVNFTKPRGKAAAKTNGTSSGDSGMTEQERESLKIVGGREIALGLWHGVGKVVYNKRVDPPFGSSSDRDAQTVTPASSTPPRADVTTPPSYLDAYRRPKIPENDPEQLLIDLSTDVSTFVASIHENFLPSCSTSSPQKTLECIEDCLAVLSDGDILSIDRYGPGFTAKEGMRQEEISFHTAVRGVVFSLPYPVKREMPGNPTARNRTHVMAWPQSMRLWRAQEETDDLAEHIMEDYTRTIITDTNKADGESVEDLYALKPSASTKETTLLEQIPYMRILFDAKRSNSAIKEKVSKVASFGTLHMSGFVTNQHGMEDEKTEDPASPQHVRSRRTRMSHGDGTSFAFGMDEDVKGLVLSDDDIVD